MDLDAQTSLVLAKSVAVVATATEDWKRLRLCVLQELLHAGTCVCSACFGTMGLTS